MDGENGNKYTLFADNGGGLQAKLYDADRDLGSAPRSARGDRGSSAHSRQRHRPTSAQSARATSADRARRQQASPIDREARSVGGSAIGAGNRKLDGGDGAFYQLEREDLLNTCLELKKNQKITDVEIAKLKYENQRLETENLKAQRRIEKLLGPQISKSGQTTSEIRRDIEKTAIVRQLKGQILELRELLLSKDKLVDTMQKSQKASQLLELMAEKEEYYLEVQRLKTSLQTQTEEMHRLQGRGGSGANYRGSSIEDELRAEINRLSTGYNELLTQLTQSEKERQLERIAQEEAFMRQESRVPIEPASSRSGRRGSGGGRNQVKKTYSEPQPVPVNAAAKSNKRPGSASTGRRKGSKDRSRSRDPSPGNRRRNNEEEIFAEPTNNDEWLSMTFGSGSIDPMPAQPPPSNSVADSSNPSPTKENGRPVSSRRGKPAGNISSDQAGTLPALQFAVGDKVCTRLEERVGVVKSIDLLDMVCVISYSGGEELAGVPTAEVMLVSPRRKNRSPREKTPVDVSGSSSPAPEASVAITFRTSDKVNLITTNSKRAGTIIKFHQSDGLYDVMLDKGGEIVYNVPAKCLEIREKPSPKKAVKPKANSALPPLLIVGTPVNARYKGSDYWYPGVIREIEPGANSYAIHFDDGEIVCGVPTDHVDLKDNSGDASAVPNGLQVNTLVEANFLGKGVWYPGRVTMNRGGQSYDITYDDNEQEVGVTLDRLRVNGVVLAPTPTSLASSAQDAAGTTAGQMQTNGTEQTYPSQHGVGLSPPVGDMFPEGSVVEGKYNKIIWRPAVVTKVNCIYKYLVEQDNGQQCVRAQSELRSLGDSPNLFINCPVAVVSAEGNVSGSILDVLTDYLYDLRYTDNAKASRGSEEDVSSEYVRSTNSQNQSPMPSAKPMSPRWTQPYSEQDDVEVLQDGDWVRGTLTRIYLRGYEVVYDVTLDGSSVGAEGVQHDNIRHCVGGKNSCSHYFKLESQIEAFDTQLASWRLGTVKKLNENGSYDVVFTNGERHDNVLGSYVRVASEEDFTAPSELVAPGGKPEASEAWKPTPAVARSESGNITATEPFPLPDNSGEVTPRIDGEAALTHDTSPLPDPTAPLMLAKGSTVEAKYRGQEKWYPGVIIREHPDDTVDIDYDDGERETRVRRENIRPLVPKDDLMDYLAGLSDEEGDAEPDIEYGIAAGGVVYETADGGLQQEAAGGREGSEQDNDYADDFD